MRYQVYPLEVGPKEVLVVSVGKTKDPVHKIANQVCGLRPHWGKKKLKILEFGGTDSWTIDWKERVMLPCH